MTPFVRKFAATSVAMMFSLITACGGGGDGGTPMGPPITPPPVTPKVTIKSMTVPPRTAQSNNPRDYPFTGIVISALAENEKGESVEVKCSVALIATPTNRQPAKCDAPSMLMPGEYKAFANASGAQEESRSFEVYVPALSGKAVAFDADGKFFSPVDQKFTVHGDDGFQDDNFTVGAGGTFTYASPRVGLDGLAVFTPSTSTQKGFFLRTIPEFWAKANLVLGPKFINTPVCSTTGPSERVNIDLSDLGPAYKLASDATSLFPRSAGAYFVGSFRSPVKVAFDSAISPSDSIKFWFAADSVNRATCRKLIIPANLSEVSWDKARGLDGIIVHFSPGQTAFGNNFENEQGDFHRGGVTVGLISDPAFTASLVHELFHVIFGFRHTYADASSIMTPTTSWRSQVSKQDVGYGLYMILMREAERLNDSRLSLAYQGNADEIEAGRDERAIVYVDALGKKGSTSIPALKSKSNNKSP